MLAGTLAWSWAWLGLAALTGRSWLAFPTVLLTLTGLLGVIAVPALLLWCGYAQEGLQRRMPVVAASLVIGAVWSAWHLPLFLLEGTYQYDLGIGTAGFWAFQAGPVVLAVVYGWRWLRRPAPRVGYRIRTRTTAEPD